MEMELLKENFGNDLINPRPERIKETAIPLESFSNSIRFESKMTTPAVEVKNACKAYGSSQILNNFNMTVKRGTIYGLLGASGCGKTTILSCIVGLKTLDKGEILVYGAQPGTRESGIPGRTLGYMPQDIALYEKFTIQEILNYYGRIYGMTLIEIKARMEFLVSFLDLPEPNRYISTLSGGQQRRTSLAVAMVHQPELLILDEPTVGVDPLIREGIWEYLLEMVSRGRTTVVITTHYIEEARQSNTVGLMRNGRLLVEKPPDVLLKEYGTHLLEDIVLKLCKKDNVDLIGASNMGDEISKAINETSFYTRKHRFQPSTISHTEGIDGVVGLKYKSRSPDDDTLFLQKKAQLNRRRQSVVDRVNGNLGNQKNKIRSLIYRNFLILFRHPMFVLSLLAIPTFQVAIFNSVVGKEPKNTEMAIVNREFETENFFELCQQRTNGCLSNGLSCSFFNQFPESQINWNTFSYEEDALQSVQMGKTWGIISIPENFTQHMIDRSLTKNFASNETIYGSKISARLDNSNQLKSAYLTSELYAKYLDFIKGVVTDCGENPRAVDIPLKFNAIYGSIHLGATESMQPPQVLLIIFLLPMAVAVTYIWDKKAGTLDRSMVAGVDYFHVIASLLFSEGCMILTELTLCLGVLIFVFDFTIKGSFLLCLLLCFLTGICGLSFGFLFGTLCNHELEVLICILALYLPCLTACGATWPIEGTPLWVRPIIQSLPLTLAVESIRSITGRGWGLGHPHVYPGFLMVIGWTIFCCVSSGIVHRIRK